MQVVCFADLSIHIRYPFVVSHVRPSAVTRHSHCVSSLHTNHRWAEAEQAWRSLCTRYPKDTKSARSLERCGAAKAKAEEEEQDAAAAVSCCCFVICLR